MCSGLEMEAFSAITAIRNNHFVRYIMISFLCFRYEILNIFFLFKDLLVSIFWQYLAYSTNKWHMVNKCIFYFCISLL